MDGGKERGHSELLQTLFRFNRRENHNVLLSPTYPSAGAASLSFTARIERAHSDRARSASKKDGWLLPIPLTS